MHAQLSEQSNLDGYELFRRAIVERDEQAWAEGALRYRALMITWAARCSASATLGERCEDMADYALARAWAALSPERFGQFPTLAALLAYLRACVTTTVIDCARNELHGERIAEVIVADDVATPEQVVLDRLDRDELWRVAGSVVQTAQERVVLIESYAYALPPRLILARHPDLFDGVEGIYTAKRNLLDRLRRSSDLRRLYQEWIAA